MADAFDKDPAAGQLAPVDRASKIKSEVALTATGVVLPQSLAEVAELAQYMCKAGSSIPALMRNNPGECMGVIFDAMNWGMNPFAVARQCYVVESKEGNQTRAYMSQLITAVIQKFAPIRERVIAPQYIGDGDARQCKISVHHRETDELMEYISPPIGKPLQAKADDGSKVKSPGPDYIGIWPKNSPLWRTEPDQQLWYYSIRAWARRFQPGIILGVYDIEEAREMVREMRDITPKEKTNLLEDPKDAPMPVHQGEVISPLESERHRVPVARAQMPDDLPPHNPETGEIDDEIDRAYAESDQREGDAEEERQLAEVARHERAQMAADRPEADQQREETITPERMYQNLVTGVRACLTVKDYEAWRTDNMTPATRKAIGEKWWKDLGRITAEVEDKVGFL